MGTARHPQWACRTGDQRSMEGASTRAASFSVEQLGSPVPPPCQRVSFLLPTPGKKMDLEKKEQPYLVGTKAGQMACTGGPGTPKRALSSKSRFVTIKFLVLIPNHPILSVIPQTKSDHIGMLCKQPCLGGPEPRHPNTSPNIRCVTRKLISVSHNLIILYFQFCQLPSW